MIEGLKVTVKGDELRTLCLKRASHHQERSAVYSQQVDSMRASNIEGMPHTNGDPVSALNSKKQQHESEAEELIFIADHLKLMEEYLLDSAALQKLGICKSRY